jgi:hypothetical protein
MLVRIDERVGVMMTTVGDHEKRIRSSEKFRWIAMGVIGLVTTVGGWGIFG